MGIMINGKKVAGLMIGGKKIAGAAFGGKVVYRDKPPVAVVWQKKLGNYIWNLTVDSSSNVYIANGASNIYKLDTTGTQIGSYEVTGDGTFVYTDPQSGVYVASNIGYIEHYDSAGNFIWLWQASGSVSFLAVDSSANVYAGDNSGYVTKLDSTGKKAWQWQYTDSIEAISSLAIGSSGNIYVGANTSGNSLLELNSSGVETNSFYMDHTRSIATDSAGALYVGLGMYGELYKLNDSFNTLWGWNVPGFSVNSVTVDSSNNVYAGDDSGYVTKLDSTGKQVWQWKAPAGVNSVAVDSQFNIYVGDSDGYVTKLQTENQ